MRRFFLTGHRSFSNRGCEAIVRSTAALLRAEFGDVAVIVPSDNLNRDSSQWPEASEQGVSFMPAFSPWYTRHWVHAQRLPLRALKQAGWPFPLPRSFRASLADVDAVLSVGGDNYSLDYRLPSLLMGIDGAALAAGKPVVLWGASVGPFEKEPAFVPVVRKHLARMSLIAARESVTLQYLEAELGLRNVTRMTDPAFDLALEAVDLEGFWPDQAKAGVLGLNVSPLLHRYRPKGEPPGQLVEDVSRFVQQVVREEGLSVLLVPHVMSHGGNKKNDDAFYMSEILVRTTDLERRVRLAPVSLNAAQLKFVISRCRYFIGARTHATIAALSSGVPTASIAYSIKANGIMKDLFGHTDYVLDTGRLGTATLRTALGRLLDDEDLIKAHLAQRIPEWQEVARDGVRKLKGLLT